MPFNPGGGFDAVGRQLAVPMQNILGQPVVIKNVPGGGQRIGARQFEQAPADGHTLIFSADNNLLASTFVEPPEGFDLNNWAWVASIRRSPVAAFVRRDSPFQTIQDVIAADAAGQRIRMAHGGIGNYLPQQVVLASSLGFKNVAYVGGYTGTADIIPALVRGDVDLEVVTPISSVLQFIRSGDIRPILVLDPTRNDLVPTIPTARELGLPNLLDIESLGESNLGLAVKKGTPADRIAVLEQAVLAAMKDPGFVDWARQTGVEPDLNPLGGQAMVDVKRREYALYSQHAAAMRAANQ